MRLSAPGDLEAVGTMGPGPVRLSGPGPTVGTSGPGPVRLYPGTWSPEVDGTMGPGPVRLSGPWDLVLHEHVARRGRAFYLLHTFTGLELSVDLN